MFTTYNLNKSYNQLHDFFNKNQKFLVLCFKGLKDKNNMVLPRILYATSFALIAIPSLVCISQMLLIKIAYKSVKKIRDFIKKQAENKFNSEGIGTILHTPLHIVNNLLDIIYHFLKIGSKSIDILCTTSKFMYEKPLSIVLKSLIKVHDVITGKETITEYKK